MCGEGEGGRGREGVREGDKGREGVRDGSERERASEREREGDRGGERGREGVRESGRAAEAFFAWVRRGTHRGPERDGNLHIRLLGCKPPERN